MTKPKPISHSQEKPRSRGSDFNPVNRFDLMFSEPAEDWDPSLKLPSHTEYYLDTTRSVVTFNDSPDIGMQASLNPYRGCEHGCIYCYARPGHEYFGLSAGLDFESKIFVKKDAAVLLRKELSRPRWEPQVVVLSGVTDPYQPVEKKLSITRACLEVLQECRNPVAIITKNFLVTRDVDIFRRMNEYHGCAVNVSVTSLDPQVARRMEPRASTPSDRLKAIERLAQAGIPVQVMVAPVVPGLTDHEMPAILKAAADAGASRAGYVMLRLPYAVKDLFPRWLEDHFPERKEKILNRIRSVRRGKLNVSEFGERMRGAGIFAGQIQQIFDLHCRRNHLNERSVQLSAEHFRKPAGPQLTLFDDL